MHTDEYEISLSRELGVCRATIQRIKKTLELLEQKHTKKTEVFIEELKIGKLQQNPELKEDYEAWQSSYESLLKWQELEKEYDQIFRDMKI